VSIEYVIRGVDKIRFHTGARTARTGKGWNWSNSADCFIVNGTTQVIHIMGREVYFKKKGVEIMVEIPYEVMPEIIEAFLKSMIRAAPTDTAEPDD